MVALGVGDMGMFNFKARDDDMELRPRESEREELRDRNIPWRMA